MAASWRRNLQAPPASTPGSRMIVLRDHLSIIYGLRGVKPMPIERRRKPSVARARRDGCREARFPPSERRQDAVASVREMAWASPRAAGPVGRIGSPAGDMLVTFGLCEYCPDRSCQLHAPQSSSVPARAPSRLLSITGLRVASPEPRDQLAGLVRRLVTCSSPSDFASTVRIGVANCMLRKAPRFLRVPPAGSSASQDCEGLCPERAREGPPMMLR